MSKLKDLTGQKFGRLTVIERLPNYRQENGRTRTRWRCLCDCGREYIGDGSHILHGDVISCGCVHNERAKSWGSTGIPARTSAQKRMKNQDLTGKRFGRLLVVERDGFDKNRKAMWICQCDCGSTCSVRANHLRRGLINSCGCLRSVSEEWITKFLNRRDGHVRREITFPNLISSSGGLLRFDYGLYDENDNLIMLIEYQGEQHDPKKTGEFGKQQREETDAIKRQFCAENNIRLEYIWYYDDLEYSMFNLFCEAYGKPIPCQAQNLCEGVTTISEESRGESPKRHASQEDDDIV